MAFDARLISALVDTLAEVDFDPAVLQVLGSEVWQQAAARARGGPIRPGPDDLAAAGDVGQVFQGYLDQVTREIPGSDPRRKIHTRAVLDALISQRRTKLAVTREDLLEQYFVIAPEQLEEVLGRLHRHRLVRLDPRRGVSWIELVHERLVEVILPWLEADLDFFKFRAAHNLVVNSCRNPGWRENPELLLTRGQIDDTVGPFKELLRFTTEERLFLVSSATYAHSRDLELWAELAGYGTSAELLDRFLDQDDNERVRQRAAQATGRVADRGGHFAERCLALALGDPSPAVRRAAGRSFADLASQRELETLAERLAERKSRKAAVEVLTEMIDKDRLPAGVKLGRRRLRQARRQLYERRLAASQEILRERGARGAVSGLVAGFVWMATAGALLLRMVLYEIYPMLGVGIAWAWPAGVLGCMLFGLAVGALVGWRAALIAGKEALRTGREGCFFRALFRRVVPRLCGAVLVAWVGVVSVLVLRGSPRRQSKVGPLYFRPRFPSWLSSASSRGLLSSRWPLAPRSGRFNVGRPGHGPGFGPLVAPCSCLCRPGLGKKSSQIFSIQYQEVRALCQHYGR